MSFSITLSPFIVICILAGLSLISLRWMMIKFPPKRNSFLYGYRTPSSWKSQERWDFAQEYSSKKALQGGLFLILIGMAGFFIKIPYETSLAAGLITVVLSSIILIILVELAIRKKFKD